MIVTSQKKKIIIFKLEVTKLERNLPFEIILPTGTKKVTSITITNSNQMALLGTITLRSMDSSDVFLMDNVWEDGKVIVESEVIDEGWNGEHPWESGRVPSDRPLDIEGDSNILLGWFKGINFTQGFTILICVECQEEEEFVSKVRDEEG